MLAFKCIWSSLRRRRSKPSVYRLYKGFRRVRGPAATQANMKRKLFLFSHELFNLKYSIPKFEMFWVSSLSIFPENGFRITWPKSQVTLNWWKQEPLTAAYNTLIFARGFRRDNINGGAYNRNRAIAVLIKISFAFTGVLSFKTWTKDALCRSLLASKTRTRNSTALVT